MVLQKRNQKQESQLVTVGQNYFDVFLMRCKVDGLSSSTLRNYEYVLRGFRGFLGQIFVYDVTPHCVRQYLGQLRDRKVSAATLATHHRILSVFFSYLVAEGLLLESPMKQVSKPKLPKRYPHCLEEHQISALLENCSRGTYERDRNRVIILTLLGSGIRLSELVGLNTADIRLSDGLMRVVGKGNKERTVCMGKTLSRAIHRYIGQRIMLPGVQYQDALFVSRDGERLKPRNVHQIIARIGKKAGISGVRVSPHTLRHTFATRYISNGGDPYSLQELLGHSDPKTTMVYVHMTGRRLKEAFVKADPLGDMYL
ncbi:MAG: site-specific tyrosine recombinase/integron integrase [Thermoleophilia bacterium]